MAINIPIISEFDGKGIDKAIKEFKQLETAGEKAQFAIKKAAVPAAAALTALAVAGTAAAKAAIEDEKSAAELARTLQVSTKATDEQVASVEQMISKMTLATGVADTDLRNALSTLARGMGDTTKAQETLNLALDISAATGKDLATVSESLSKAYNGQETALAKLDPSLRGLIKSGGDFDDIGKKLSETFGGAAAKAAETTEGKFKRLNTAFGEAQESIGQALIPILEAFLPILQDVAEWLGDNKEVVKILAVAVGGLATAVLTANAALKVYETATLAATAAQKLFNLAVATNPFVAFTAGFIALTVAAYKFREEIATINEKLDEFFDKFGLFGKAAKIGGLKSLPVFDYLLKAGSLFKQFLSDDDKSPSSAPGIRPMASGGLVMSPTLALIGEAGPEAVVPLDRMGGMGNNIVINVNGGDPNQVVEALKKYVRSNGTLPSAIKLAA
jgi:hypothetical protein